MELAINEQRLSQKSQFIILAVALAQGIALYWFQHSIEISWWPSKSGPSVTVLGLWLTILPTSFALSYRSSVATKSYWLSLLAMMLLLLAIGVYFGRAYDLEAMREGGFAVLVAAVVLWFIVLFWLKAALHEQKLWPSYASLFGYSWHNFLCITLASLFALIFFGVLMLWGKLFEVINIDFFTDLFLRSWFLFPSLVMAFAYALILFRTQINAVGVMQRILRALFSILLLVIGLVTILFVAFLPVTGIELIWMKGYGSDTILLFVGIALFLYNAVFQDASEQPYGDLLTRIARFIPVVLLILVALALYGIALRIQQHGLSVQRIWAAILVAIMAAFTLAYSLQTLFRSEGWQQKFNATNRVMACVIALLLVFTVSPHSSLNKMAIASQLNRLHSGQVSPELFDYAYIARLGETGMNVLEELASDDLLANNPDALTSLNHAIESNGNRYYASPPKTTEQRARITENLIVYPPDAELDLDQLLLSLSSSNFEWCEKSRACVLLLLDVTGDDIDDKILLTPSYQNTYQASRLVEYAPGQYHNVGYVNFEADLDALLNAIERGNVKTKPSPWKNIKIGDQTIKLGEPTQ